MTKNQFLEILKKYENEDFIIKSEQLSVTVYDGKGDLLYWFYFRSDGVIELKLLLLESDRIGKFVYWVQEDFNDILNTLEQARKTLNIDGLRALAHCLYAIGYGEGYKVGINE